MKQFKKFAQYLNGFVSRPSRRARASLGIWQRLDEAQANFVSAVVEQAPPPMVCLRIAELTELLREIAVRIAAVPGADQLNPREFQVLLLLLQGNGSKAIANQWPLSIAYVNNLRSRMRAKLHIPYNHRMEDVVRELMERADLKHQGIEPSVGSELAAALRALNAAAGCDPVDGELAVVDHLKLKHSAARLQQWLPRMLCFDAEFEEGRIRKDLFTANEWQVIQLIVRGCSVKDIRQAMGCSRSNVYRLRGAVRKKLGLSPAESLTAFLIRGVKH